MALTFTGKEFYSEYFEKVLEAFDGDKRVVVVTSREAIEDYGQAAVEARASEKHAKGLVDENGRVRVFTTDF